jgi:hypothetical protein
MEQWSSVEDEDEDEDGDEDKDGDVEQAEELVMVTSSSRWRDNASPMTSNPGPMLAEEHGVLITKDSDAMGGICRESVVRSVRLSPPN